MDPLEPPTGDPRECQGVSKKFRRASRADLKLEPPVKLPKSVPAVEGCKDTKVLKVQIKNGPDTGDTVTEKIMLPLFPLYR